MKNKIWILEDDLESIDIYEEIFAIDYELKIFQTIADFRNFFAQNFLKPDLMISDLRLPDGNFLDFLTKHSEPEKFSFPLIIVSSLDDKETLETAFSEGAIDYLVKPFRRVEIEVKVSKHLNNLKPKKAVYGYKLDYFRQGLSENDQIVVGLTPKELQIVRVLMDSETTGISKRDIVEKAWSGQTMYEKSFDVHLFNIRKKLRENTKLSIIQEDNGKYRLILRQSGE